MERKKTSTLVISALYAICLVFVGCTWTIDKAIIEGYTNAGLNDSNEDIVRLSENDYNEICSMFEQDVDSLYYAEAVNRWDYIKQILSDKFGQEKLKRVDKTQWLGEAKPLAISVYLDNTNSMKGYIDHDHEDDKTFVNVFHAIDDFLFRCSEQRISTDTITSYLTQKNRSTNMDEIVYCAWDDLKNQLDHDHRSLKYTDSYQLDNFLDKIVTQMETDKSHRHLSFFVTDGIPSGSNDEVTGTKWNLNKTEELKNRIRTISKRMKENYYGISIYQFEGNFYNGDYWYYDNTSKPITNRNKIMRPFYVVVLGDAEAVGLFKNEVEKHLKLFEPIENHQLHFANAVDDPYIQVKFDSQIADESDEGYFELDAGENEYINVSISIPLGSLPFSLRDAGTLGNAIKLRIEDKQSNVSPKIINDQVVYENIKLNNMFNHVELEVKNIIPKWAIDINIPNDKVANWDFTGTFNFIVLAEGLKEGFSGNEDYIFKKISKTIKINNLKLKEA